jgi:hypothetical protein
MVVYFESGIIYMPCRCYKSYNVKWSDPNSKIHEQFFKFCYYYKVLRPLELTELLPQFADILPL